MRSRRFHNLADIFTLTIAVGTVAYCRLLLACPMCAGKLARAKSSRVVCTENSDSNVLVMQPADQGVRHDASDLLNRP